jgi:hypothetical protein
MVVTNNFRCEIQCIFSRLDNGLKFSKLSAMSFKPLVIAGREFRSRLTSRLPGRKRGVLFVV